MVTLIESMSSAARPRSRVAAAAAATKIHAAIATRSRDFLIGLSFSGTITEEDSRRFLAFYREKRMNVTAGSFINLNVRKVEHLFLF